MTTPAFRLLAVDDDPRALELMAAISKLEGFEFRGLPDGDSGMKALSRFDPDVVCLDVQLPDTTGFELCRRIKLNVETRLIPVLIVTSLDDRQSKLKGIKAGCDDFLTKPVDRLELGARARVLARSYKLNRDLEESERVVRALALSVEARDPTTGNHCERVGRLAAQIGRWLGLTDAAMKTLLLAGFLHDVGKIGVPDSILLKPSRLSPQQWQVMRRHPAVGEVIVQPLRSLRDTLPVIRHHHERWDGHGYPDGLRGDQIPWEARIFQVADAYDALTNDRPYRKAMSQEEAKEVLVLEARQGKWDPTIVDLFTNRA